MRTLSHVSAGLTLALTLTLALALTLVGQAGAAQDLTGDWTFSFATDDGSSFSDPASIQQNGNRFTGTVTYTDNDQEFQEPFEGVVNADDSVVFTLYDQGEPVYHQGQVSPDGKTISGTWSFANGSGTFTITRSSGQPMPSGQTSSGGQTPNIAGDWTFSFTTEDGSTFSDPAVIQQNGDRISGVVTYAGDGREMTEPFEGTIDAAGNVEFSLNDQGQIVGHQGRLNPDGAITGTWTMDGGGQGSFTITRGAPANTGMSAPAGVNLSGSWTFSFVTEDGTSFSDPAMIQQSGDTFTGKVTYFDQGQQFEEPLDGVIRADGSVEFVLYDNGEPVQHWGRLSQDGNSIKGDWSFSNGSGTFSMTRN